MCVPFLSSLNQVTFFATGLCATMFHITAREDKRTPPVKQEFDSSKLQLQQLRPLVRTACLMTVRWGGVKLGLVPRIWVPSPGELSHSQVQNLIQKQTAHKQKERFVAR